jgi:hypothetical protein
MRKPRLVFYSSLADRAIFDTTWIDRPVDKLGASHPLNSSSSPPPAARPCAGLMIDDDCRKKTRYFKVL